MTVRPKPIRRVPGPISPRLAAAGRDVRPDAADLAAMLRDLTVRAHHAVRAIDTAPDRSGPAMADARRELVALRPRISELQQSLDAVTQQGLASYLAALSREVESRLA